MSLYEEEENTMSTVFDVELFFVYLSESIIEHPNLRKTFEEYYKTNKYRFYAHAKNSSHYNHYNMGDNRLESEVAMKRVFGILLCAEEDESIRDFVYKTILKTNPKLEELIRNPCKVSIEHFFTTNSENKAMSYQLRNAPIRFITYLLHSKYGIDSDDDAVNWALSCVHDMNIRLNRHNKESYISAYSQPRTKTVITKRIRNVTDKLKTGFDVCCFLDFCDKVLAGQNFNPLNQELCNTIEDYYRRGIDEKDDVLRAVTIARIAAGILNVNGSSTSGQLGHVNITKEEVEIIINNLASSVCLSQSKFDEWKVTISDYLIGVILMLMAKEMSEMKAFYFKNNSETQYLELQRLENVINGKDLEIELLKEELTKANELNERQREEIRQLTDAVYKEDRDAIKPFTSEISQLNSRIRDLEKTLETEQVKNPELNALREFVFSLQSEYIPTDTTITLTELVRGKKLIIVGGHINWRNKMKEKYPHIVFLDGHNVSLDISTFDRADFILFQTSNMSHKVYYKVIDYLRNRKLRFGYLGRSMNQELLESEIISIIS